MPEREKIEGSVERLRTAQEHARELRRKLLALRAKAEKERAAKAKAKPP